MRTRRGFLLSSAACLAGEMGGGVEKYKDARTGREVWRVGGGDAVSHSCYFEAQPFTADERYFVFCSNAGGTFQLHSLDLRTLRQERLTDCRALSGLSYSMHPDGRRVVYLDGDRLAETDVESGRSRLIVDLARELPGRGRFSPGRTFSSDGLYTVVSYSGGNRGGGLALVDVRAGKVKRTLDLEGGAGGHALICPADANLVSYVRMPDRQNDMSLPMSERARTMLADFRTGATRPYLTMPYGWRATHEYWGPGGARFYWHKKHVPNWVPASICSMKRDGTDWQTHFTSESLKLGHSMISADGRFIISDVQNRNNNPLLKIDLATGRHEILSWPDSTVDGGHAAHAHVHPSISPRGHYVAFTSNRGGKGRAYVQPL